MTIIIQNIYYIYINNLFYVENDVCIAETTLRTLGAPEKLSVALKETKQF